MLHLPNQNELYVHTLLLLKFLEIAKNYSETFCNRIDKILRFFFNICSHIGDKYDGKCAAKSRIYFSFLNYRPTRISQKQEVVI